MKLNNYETEFLLHRLEVPDAITDALMDYDCDDELDCPVWQGTEDELTVSIFNLTQEVLQGTLRPLKDLKEVERLVIQDCIDGSTFFAGAEDAAASGELSRKDYASQLTAAHRLGRLYGATPVLC